MQYGENRLDGLSDLLSRTSGASVLDIGCNRGFVAFEFAQNGARVVHGCDRDERVVTIARELLIDFPKVSSRFEVVDLIGGVGTVKIFEPRYDIVLMLRVTHKLGRAMSQDKLIELVKGLGAKTEKFFGWRGDPLTLPWMDQALGASGLKRVHLSQISELGTAAIWARQ